MAGIVEWGVHIPAHRLPLALLAGRKADSGPERALAWADYLRSHANRLYSSGSSMIEDGARLILERRHQLPAEFTARDIYKKDWAGLSDREVAAMAIECLVATHHCREVDKGGAGRGRPTETYCWNPALREA